MLARLFRNWPLKRQIIVVLGITIMTVGLFAGEMVREMETRAFKKNFSYQTQKLVAMLSAASLDAVVSEDRPVLDTIIRQLVDNDADVHSIAIKNEYDDELTGWMKDGAEVDSGVLMDYSHKITLEGEVFGEILATWNVTEQHEEIRQLVNKIRVFALTTFSLLTLIVVLVIHSLVVKPIGSIHSHLAKLQNTEKPEALDIVASRELQNLGETVNELGNILELRKQKEIELKEASRAKSEFLANMSHELRTPMNGVLGMLNIIRNTSLNPEQGEAVKIATSSGKSLLTLINDILDFSKIEAGRLEFEVVEFEIHSLLEDCTEILAEQAHSKNLELLCTIDKDIPQRVKGDPTRIRQVLTNLLGNAVKFTSNGEVLIQLSYSNKLEHPNRLKFAVIDTGVGISKDALSRVFESFAQADGSTTRQFGGTGLGLAISKELVIGMNGLFHVTSEIGKGSVFWFELDLPAIEDTGKEPEYYAELGEIKALVIDANYSSRDKLLQTLQTRDINCTVEQNGKAALKIIRDASNADDAFDVIVFSSILEDMPGDVFVNCVSADPEYDDLKLISMTSVVEKIPELYPHNNRRISGQITKPIRSQELLKSIAHSIGIDIGVDLQATVKTQEPPSLYGQIRILVVEDNIVNQEVALGMLNIIGFQADTADNGKDGLFKLQESDYDLVLMDCQMPVMDGYEATRQIRGLNSDLRSTPIIALTANAMTGDAEKCLAAGMDDYLSKPFEPEVLEERICHWLEDKLKKNNNNCSQDAA